MRIARGVVVSFFLLAGLAFSQTNVGGSISKDSTWTLAKSPYIVTSSVTVNSGFTLTVDSGVVVRFQPGTYLYVNGTAALKARHTRFTSSKDTAGGSPAKGDWGYIQIGNNSAATGTFDTCTVLWGGVSNNPEIYVNGGNATIRNTSVSSSKYYGVMVDNGATTTIENSTISGCTWPIAYIVRPTCCSTDRMF